jgi:hypothetical protein
LTLLPVTEEGDTAAGDGAAAEEEEEDAADAAAAVAAPSPASIEADKLLLLVRGGDSSPDEVKDAAVPSAVSGRSQRQTPCASLSRAAWLSAEPERGMGEGAVAA